MQSALLEIVLLALLVADEASFVAAGVIRDQPMPFPPSYYQLTPAEMADNNYPVPVLDLDTGELRCPPGFVVTQPAGNGIARAPAFDMLVRHQSCSRAYGLGRSPRHCASGTGAGLRDVLHSNRLGGHAV